MNNAVQRTTISIMYVLIAMAVFAACGEDGPKDPTKTQGQSHWGKIKGTANKGPYAENSTVQVTRVDAMLQPLTSGGGSGKTDALGAYAVNVDMQAQEQGVVLLSVDGRFYNEATGELSKESYPLEALARLSVDTIKNIHINVLTHIVTPRLKSLVAEGKSFNDAVTQAEQEIVDQLALGRESFRLPKPASSIALLGGTDEASAYLLLVSAVLAHANEGDEARMAEFIRRLREDFADDGQVDDALRAQLSEAQRTLDEQRVMEQLKAYVQSQQGDVADLPDLPGLLEQTDRRNMAVISGAITKGPFVAGSTVIVTLLDDNGSSIGVQQETTTQSDLGDFEIAVDLGDRPERFALIEGTGAFYDEMKGDVSATSLSSPLTLRAFVYLRAGTHSARFINVVTHLTIARIQALRVQGLSFGDAVRQAERELQDELSVGVGHSYPIGDVDAVAVHPWDETSTASAYLLLVQGMISRVAERIEPLRLSDMMNRMALDLADDGKLNAPIVDSSLWADLRDQHTRFLDVNMIGQKFLIYALSRGIDVNLPDVHRLTDFDGDGIVDSDDNCRYLANPDQQDLDPANGIGDSCDVPIANMHMGGPISETFGQTMLCTSIQEAVNASGITGLRCIRGLPGFMHSKHLVDTSYAVSGSFHQVASTIGLVCARVAAADASNNTLRCWEPSTNNDLTEVTNPGPRTSQFQDGTAYDQLASSERYLCAVRSDRSAIDCWPGLANQSGVRNRLSIALVPGEAVQTIHVRRREIPTTPHPTTVFKDDLCFLIESTGQVRCVELDHGGGILGGIDAVGDPVPSPDASLAFSAYSSGEGYDCGILRGSGAIHCSLYPDGKLAGLVLNPPPPGRYTAIDTDRAGGICALRDDGRVICWGILSTSYVNYAPYDVQFLSFKLTQDPGLPGGCGIDTAKQLHCWGVGPGTS